MSGTTALGGQAPGQRPPTSHEVARRAGVSRATVSYVINNATHQRISPVTRARVLAAAKELGYSPNPAALALRSGRNDIVLLAFPQWPHGPVMVEAIDAAVAELSALGYTPLAHLGREEGPRALAEVCQRIQPVGLVAPAGSLTRAFAGRLHTTRTRGIVAIGPHPLGYVPTVVVVQAEIGRAAVEHLVGRGYRDLLAVMPEGGSVRDLREGRLTGARAAAKSGGARIKLATAAPDISEIDAGLATWLECAARGPRAVYAFNDDYAFLALRSLLQRGLAVPEDVAVIGTDDVGAAQLFRPSLTTVRIDGRGFGSVIAAALHGAVSGTEPGGDCTGWFEPVVVEREST